MMGTYVFTNLYVNPPLGVEAICRLQFAINQKFIHIYNYKNIKKNYSFTIDSNSQNALDTAQLDPNQWRFTCAG
jgi:hypothetical protein